MVKVGLAGLGGMGKVHYANFAKIEDAEVTAVCGTSGRARKTAAEWGLPCYETITQMLRSEEIDLVDICTPTYLHHDMVMESLRMGRDTICEKPIALSLSDAREMLDEAKKQGCHLYIAQVLQFTREVQILREVVKSGELGKPLDAVFERLSACPRWAADGWLFDRAKSGQLYYDLHIHDLDVIVSVFGTPVSFSSTTCRGPDKTYPEQLRVQYAYPGFHVVAEAAWFNADIPWTARWRVYFENGMLISDEHGLVSYQFGREPFRYDTSDEVVVSTGINVPPCGWYYNELKHFVACHRQDADSPLVPAGQLLDVMSILEAISNHEQRKS